MQMTAILTIEKNKETATTKPFGLKLEKQRRRRMEELVNGVWKAVYDGMF